LFPVISPPSSVIENPIISLPSPHHSPLFSLATKVGDKLEKPLHQLREAARRVAEICDESEIAMDVEEYVAKVSVYVRFYPIGTPELYIYSIGMLINLFRCVHA
jgi:hypothetical protein